LSILPFRLDGAFITDIDPRPNGNPTLPFVAKLDSVLPILPAIPGTPNGDLPKGFNAPEINESIIPIVVEERFEKSLAASMLAAVGAEAKSDIEPIP
jgi:hypothetical protein